MLFEPFTEILAQISVLETLENIQHVIGHPWTTFKCLLNDLGPSINMHVPYLFFIYFYDTSWATLLKHQDIPHLVVISFILVTCMFGQVVILYGGI